MAANQSNSSTQPTSVPTTEQAAPQAAPGENPKTTQQKKNRRGQGSRANKSEQHRIKKNEQWDKDQQERIQRWKDSFKIDTDDIVNLRQQTMVVSSPTRKVDITTGYFSSIVVHSVRTLHRTCKIPPPAVQNPEAFDIQTVLWVTQIQIEAKLFFGVLGTQFALPSGYHQYADFSRVANLFPTALLPVAAGIDRPNRKVCGRQSDHCWRPGPTSDVTRRRGD